MLDKTIFILSFRLLIKHKPNRLLLLFFLTLFLGTSSGLTIVLLIPLLQLVTQNSIETSNPVVDFFNDVAQYWNIDLNLENILITYIVILSTMAFINYWNSLLNAKYQQSLIFNIRKRLFRKIIMADWPKLNTKSKSSHLQILTQEIPNLSNYYFFLMRLFIALLMTISYLAWALIISVEFTLAIVVVGFILFFTLRRFLVKAFHLGGEQLTSYNHLLKYIDDFWSTVKIAKVHSSEDFYYNTFGRASSSLFDIEIKMQKNHYLPQLIYRLMGLIILVVTVYVGYRYALIPLTSFFILIILFARIYPQFTSINSDLSMIISSLASVKLVMQVDDEFDDPNMHQHQNVNPLPLHKTLNIKRLHFSYTDKDQLFENFSTTIPAYHLVGIIGESGKGKTTLLDIIAGLQYPDEGKIEVDGKALDKNSWPHWRNGIGYLPQDSFFIDGTIRENLVWDCRRHISDTELYTMLEKVNALHLVDRQKDGLDAFIVNYPFHFSGGERQRLALARVLLRNPQILLLDEATSSLDEDNEKQIMDLLSSLKQKLTIVLVTHKTTVKKWLDDTIMLD